MYLHLGAHFIALHKLNLGRQRVTSRGARAEFQCAATTRFQPNFTLTVTTLGAQNHPPHNTAPTSRPDSTWKLFTTQSGKKPPDQNLFAYHQGCVLEEGMTFLRYGAGMQREHLGQSALHCRQCRLQKHQKYRLVSRAWPTAAHLPQLAA